MHGAVAGACRVLIGRNHSDDFSLLFGDPPPFLSSVVVPMMHDAPHPRLQPVCFVCEVIPGPLRSCETVHALGPSISTRFFLSSSNFWTLPLGYLALPERNAFQPRLVVHILVPPFCICSGVETLVTIKSP
jgi:hypothetical protein